MKTRRELTFEPFRTGKEVTPEELEHVRQESMRIIDGVGIVIQIITILHLLFSGMAIAFIVVLLCGQDYQEFLSYYVYLAQPTDIMFYIFEFVFFVSNFLLTGIMFYVRYRDQAAKIIMIIVLVLLGISLVTSTITMPSSVMLNRITNDLPDWYDIPVISQQVESLIAGAFKILIIIRMVCIILSSVLSAFICSGHQYFVFYDLLVIVKRGSRI